MIFWRCASAAAKERFWKAVYDYADARYELQPASSVDKYTKMCQDAVELQELGWGSRVIVKISFLIARAILPACSTFSRFSIFLVPPSHPWLFSAIDTSPNFVLPQFLRMCQDAVELQELGWGSRMGNLVYRAGLNRLPSGITGFRGSF